MPQRRVDRGHREYGLWGRWGRLVIKHPLPVAIVGLAIVGLLVAYGTQLNPNESQLKNFPGTGTAIAGRQSLQSAGITPGVMKPLIVLVEHGADPQTFAARLDKVDGVVGATAPASWKAG